MYSCLPSDYYIPKLSLTRSLFRARTLSFTLTHVRCMQTYLKETHLKNCTKGPATTPTAAASTAAAAAAAAAAAVFDDDDDDMPLSQRREVVHLANAVALAADSVGPEYELIPRNPCRSCGLQVKKKVRKLKYKDPEVRSKSLNLACPNCPGVQISAWDLAASDKDGTSAARAAGDEEAIVKMQVGEEGDKIAACHKCKQNRKGPAYCLGMGHQQRMLTTAVEAAAAAAGGSSDDDQDLPLKVRQPLKDKGGREAAGGGGSTLMTPKNAGRGDNREGRDGGGDCEACRGKHRAHACGRSSGAADDLTRGKEAENAAGKRVNTRPMAEAARRKKSKPNFKSAGFAVDGPSPSLASAPRARDGGSRPKTPGCQEFLCPLCDRDFSSFQRSCRQVV